MIDHWGGVFRQSEDSSQTGVSSSHPSRETQSIVPKIEIPTSNQTDIFSKRTQLLFHHSVLFKTLHNKSTFIHLPKSLPRSQRDPFSQACSTGKSIFPNCCPAPTPSALSVSQGTVITPINIITPINTIPSTNLIVNINASPASSNHLVHLIACSHIILSYQLYFLHFPERFNLIQIHHLTPFDTLLKLFT